MQLTLLQRPGGVKVQDFDTTVQDAFSRLESELSARAKLVGYTKKGWAQVDVTGDDREILEELIYRDLGRAITSLHSAEFGGNYSGFVGESRRGFLEVDIGVETPKPVNVKIDVKALNAQLCDGKSLSLGGIMENYCLQPESKVAVRITGLDRESGALEGWLADSQIEYYTDAISSNLERIQINHCTRAQVDSAVRRMNLERDVISVESMTLTCHSVVCKLGTNAIGLIPKLGTQLRESQLLPFIPDRIMSRCRKW